MQQINNIIQKEQLICQRKISIHNFQSSQGVQSNQFQCPLRFSEFCQKNHPIKICLNDHNMCQRCVDKNIFKQVKRNQNQTGIKVQICPFCNSYIDDNIFVKNYKTLNYINQVRNKDVKRAERNQPNRQEQSMFQKLCQQNYRFIMQFLCQKDKISLSSTNLFLRSLLMNGDYWGQFQVCSYLSANKNSSAPEQTWKLKLKWIEKYFSIIKPNRVKVVLLDFYQQSQLVTFFLKSYPWVNKMTVYCQSIQIHLAISKSCSQITDLNVSSGIFSDDLLKEMTKTMKKIKKFSVVKDDVNFCGSNLSINFPQGLQTIVMKPHMLEFQQIALLAKKNPQFLRVIQLDVENCQQKVLIQILSLLSNVQVLKLFHMQNIHIPYELSKSLSNKVRQLYLTKTYEMPIKLIVDKIATPKLLTLDFSEVNMLDDSDIIVIAKNCPYLKRLNISWCNRLTQSSIANLIQICILLQHLNLTGQKCLTDKVFRQYNELLPYFDQNSYYQARNLISEAKRSKKTIQALQFKSQNFFSTQCKLIQKDQSIQRSETQQGTNISQRIKMIKMLRNLKYLNCTSCNSISDKMLRLIYIVNRKVNAINYYENQMGLYSIDQFSYQC